jgi:hypothetical protein
MVLPDVTSNNGRASLKCTAGVRDRLAALQSKTQIVKPKAWSGGWTLARQMNSEWHVLLASQLKPDSQQVGQSVSCILMANQRRIVRLTRLSGLPPGTIWEPPGRPGTGSYLEPPGTTPGYSVGCQSGGAALRIVSSRNYIVIGGDEQGPRLCKQLGVHAYVVLCCSCAPRFPLVM